MNDMTWFTILSTIGAALAIAIGVLGPAFAMGKAISQALDALARQPEAEQSIMRTLFIGLAMIESLAIYVLVIVLIILFRNPLCCEQIDMSGFIAHELSALFALPDGHI